MRRLTRRGLVERSHAPDRAALAKLALDRAVLDGELVVPRNGISDFQSLQSSLSARRDEHCVYYAVDLLALRGKSLARLVDRAAAGRGSR